MSSELFELIRMARLERPKFENIHGVKSAIGAKKLSSKRRARIREQFGSSSIQPRVDSSYIRCPLAREYINQILRRRRTQFEFVETKQCGSSRIKYRSLVNINPNCITNGAKRELGNSTVCG